MLLDDLISKSIYEYPDLYLFRTYEESKLAVLSCLFLTIGNGYSFAKTKKVSKGGYLTEEKLRLFKGEYVRCYDEPYGKVKYAGPNLDDIYSGRTNIVIVMPDDFGIGVVPLFHGTSEEFDESKFTEGRKRTFGMRHSFKKYKWDPYPFSLEHSVFADFDYNAGVIQNDYAVGALFVVRKALEYFSKPEEYSDYYKGYMSNKLNYHKMMYQLLFVESILKHRLEKNGISFDNSELKESFDI